LTASGAAYIEEVVKAGVPADSFAPRLAFYSSHQDLSAGERTRLRNQEIGFIFQAFKRSKLQPSRDQTPNTDNLGKSAVIILLMVEPSD